MSREKCNPPTLNEKRWSTSLRHLDTFFNEVMQKKSTNVSGKILSDVNALESDVGCSRFNYRTHDDRVKIVLTLESLRDACITESVNQKRSKKSVPKKDRINCGIFTEVIDALADTWNCDIERTAGKILDTGSRDVTRCSYVLTEDELQRLETRGKKSNGKHSVGEVLQWLHANYKK